MSVNAFCEENLTNEDRAKFGIAQSQLNLGRFDDAVKGLTELYEKYPENKEITLMLAQALGYGLRLEESRALLDRLLSQSPGDRKILYVYATILESNQHFTEARNTYFNLLKEDPSDEALRLKIADVSTWMGDYDTAIEYYRALLERNRDDAELKGKLADVLLWSKRQAEAVTLYQELGLSAESDPERYKYLGDAYLGLGEFDKAIGIYRNLLRLYPEDLEIKINIANALYAAKRVDEAEGMFRDIMKQSPGDVKVMIRIAEILALRHKYDDAIKICDDILAVDPRNSFAKLWMARISSWDKRYGESLKLYREIIKENPKWIIARRELARVLGWTRRYWESLWEYRKILTRVKDDEASMLEMYSKDNFYKFYDGTAIHYYNKWLRVEPENLEALYDLGQVYARQMQWANARKTYEGILRIIPEHFRAQEALDKVNLRSKAITAEAGFEMYEADSTSREIDKKYFDIYAKLSAPLGEDLYFTLKEDTFFYLFAEPSRVNRERIEARVEYFKKPFLWASAGYAYSIYSDNIINSHNFMEEVNIRPIDPLLFTFTHKREDVIENGNTLTSNLKKDDFKIRGEARPARRFLAGMDYKYSHYTDGNDRNEIGIDTSVILLYEPHFLKVFYRYEDYGFSKPKSDYFTPSSFHTNRVGVEWRHFLNKEELFWGTNDTYYTLRYHVSCDVGDQRGHTFYADFHRDWNDRFSTHVEWSKTIYEHRKTYSENMLMAYIRYHF